MKNKVWLVLFSYLFCSCDWYGDYHYEIRNELENDTILVEALYFKDTTFIIPPMEQLRIRSVASGNIGKDTDPPDIFTKELSDFDSIKIYWNRVPYFRLTFAINEHSPKRNGISFSNYINVNLHGVVNQENHPDGWMYIERGLFCRKYRHTFQSERFGLSYLLEWVCQVF